MIDIIKFYIGLAIFTLVISITSAILVSDTFSKYYAIPNKRKLTGYEAARLILDYNGLYSIKIKKIVGNYTDCYNPLNKTIYLSENTYNNLSVAAVSIAAHECGHAIQHNDKSVMMGLTKIRVRAAKSPGLIILASFLLFGIGLFTFNIWVLGASVIVFFGLSLVDILNLPIEFDASRRALCEVDKYRMLSQDELEGARKVLSSAALTYVASLAKKIFGLITALIVIFVGFICTITGSNRR